MDGTGVASTAFIGVNSHSHNTSPFPTPPTLQEALAQGMRLVTNDGSRTKCVMDGHERLLVIILEDPKDPDWKGVGERAAYAAQEAATGCVRQDDDESHRRGDFFTLHDGFSMGGGQQVAILRIIPWHR